MAIPLIQDEMDSQFEGTWYEHNCFLNMGVHYFNFNYQPDQDCDETIPFQVLYTSTLLIDEDSERNI